MRRSNRCQRCHHNRPNPAGCAKCNPEELGRQLTIVLEQRKRLSDDLIEKIRLITELERQIQAPIPMRLPCEICGELHVDVGEFATKFHHTHACQNCGHVWRPAAIATVGVRFIPGFKNPT